MPRRRKPLERTASKAAIAGVGTTHATNWIPGAILKPSLPRPISALQRQQSGVKSYSWRHRMC